MGFLLNTEAALPQNSIGITQDICHAYIQTENINRLKN
jgi:hypothetical protein